MKRSLIIASLVVLILAHAAFAVDIILSPNQVTLTWDAPPSTTEILEYKVWIADLAKSAPMVVGQTKDLEFSITFPLEGDWVLGVSTLRISENREILGEILAESVIAWTDMEEYVAEKTFIIRYYSIEAPTRLRIR